MPSLSLSPIAVPRLAVMGVRSGVGMGMGQRPMAVEITTERLIRERASVHKVSLASGPTRRALHHYGVLRERIHPDARLP